MADIRAMSTSTPHNTALIIIGDEILTGKTQDVNTSFLAAELASIGLPLAEVRVVPDIEAEIVAAVNALRRKFKYVFTTGGIGPTHDDITADSVAAAFGVKIIEHPEALRRLEEYYADAPGKVNEARRRMTHVPEGASLIDNPVSAAPGFIFENVYVMAGVPNIMRAMFLGIKPTLQGGPPLLSKSVRCRIFEGDLAAELTVIAKKYSDLSIGSYPSMRDGRPLVTLVVRGTDEARLAAAARDIADMISKMGDTPDIAD